MLPYTQPAPYFAQWGEDRWLVEHLGAPATGVFVDIGAGDGVRGSNSRYFEALGWTSTIFAGLPAAHSGARGEVIVHRLWSGGHPS